MNIIIVLFVFFHVIGIATFAQLVDGKNFALYFKFHKEIKIPNNIILGNIETIDAFQNNKLLILDGIGSEVYLINTNNDVIKKLNPEICNPGFHWRPLYTFFDKKGLIYIVNSAPWGFRFGKNGECIGPMDNTFLATYSIAFTSKNKIIGYYTTSDGNYLKVMDENGVEDSRFGLFPEEFKNLIKRFEYGGIVIDKFDNLYQLNANNPKIFKYDKTKNKIKEFVHYPSYYRAVKEDLPSDVKKIFTSLPRITGEKTLSQKIFLLDDDKIAIQLYHKKTFSYGLEIFDLEGRYLLDKEITFNTPIKNAKNGLIYFEYQKDADRNGNLENPSILIYQLNMK